MSSFVTYGYFAGAHVDRDESPSLGRVLHRDPVLVSLDQGVAL